MNREEYISILEIENAELKKENKDLKKQLEQKDKEIKTKKFLSYLINQFNTTQNTLYLDIIMKYEEIFEEGKDE